MSITIRNNYPIDPGSPTVEIDRGTGKAKTTDRVAPQQSAPLGEGDLTVRVVFPKTETAAAKEEPKEGDA